MRIGYLVNQYPRTSHSFIRRELLALEAHGLEVLRFSLRPLDEELVDEADRRELQLTRVVLDQGVLAHARAVAAFALRRPTALGRAIAQALRLGWMTDRGVLRHLVYLAEAAVLARWLEREGVQHLHAHFGTNSAAVAALCRALGGPPYSFTVHGSELEAPRSLRLSAKVRHAAFTVAVSEYGRTRLLQWSRRQDWQKIHVVHTGLAEDLLRSPPVPIPTLPRLVCVARMVALKGHAVLIEAAARLAAEGVEFEIVLAGDGPERARVAELIRRAGLERRFRLGGWMSSRQVRDEILGARALVLPSFSEGLPVVIMEALALGRPAIATAVGGVPELVEPGVTGWLVPAREAGPLARAMREALEAPPARLEDMGRAGRAAVALRHDASSEATKLARLFQASAGATRRARSPRARSGSRSS